MNSLLILATCGGQIAITSDQIRYCAGGFGIAITLASILVSWHKRSFSWAPLYGSLLLLHPAWWMGVGSGDCGMAMRFLSIAASLTLAAILICQLFWPDLSRRRFIFSLCLISWAIYFAAVLFDELVLASFDGGIAEQALFSFTWGGMDQRPVAFALSFVCVVQGVFDRMCHKRFFRATPHNAGDDQDIRRFAVKARSQSRLPLRILAALVSLLLLSWVVLYVSGFGTKSLDNTIAAILALGWSVIFVITAVRARFPGWEES